MERLLLAGLAIALIGFFTPACGIGFTTEDDDAADDDGGGDDDDVSDDDGGDDDGGDDDDDTTPSGNVSISAVSPSSGPLTGGYEAIIYGSNFTNGPDTTVFFGTALAQMIGCSGTECSVMVPATAVAGPVQVSLENGNGVGVLSDGFTYTEDLSGLTSYIVELVHYDILTPEVFKNFDSSAEALAFFMEPEEHDILDELVWGGMLPAMGSCTSYNVQTDPQTFYLSALDAGSSVSLQGPSSITLPKGAPPDDFYYFSENMPQSQYQVGSYTLEIPGGTDLAPETVNNVVLTPAPFTVNPSLEVGSVTTQQLASLPFSMTPAACTDATIRVDVYDASSVYQATELCRFPSGSNMVMNLSAYTAHQFFITFVECAEVKETPVASGATAVGLGRAVVVGYLSKQ